MENIRNRVDIKLVANDSQARKLISKPSFDIDRRKIFCDDLAAIHMHRTKLLFDKPVYLGMSILDISKTLMYDFHYGYIKEKYNDKGRLLFTDTYSLMYEIERDDSYKGISGDVLTSFDTSNYPKIILQELLLELTRRLLECLRMKSVEDKFQSLSAWELSFTLTYSILQTKEEKKCKGR